MAESWSIQSVSGLSGGEPFYKTVGHCSWHRARREINQVKFDRSASSSEEAGVTEIRPRRFCVRALPKLWCDRKPVTLQNNMVRPQSVTQKGWAARLPITIFGCQDQQGHLSDRKPVIPQSVCPQRSEEAGVTQVRSRLNFHLWKPDFVGIAVCDRTRLPCCACCAGAGAAATDRWPSRG